jgi:fermentation-respiration switch protein FrsA (DUF1100 family)
MEAQEMHPGLNSVTFTSERETLVGTLFLPDTYQPGKRLPVVIVNGPWTQVKEQIGYRYGRKLAELGVASFAMDYRFYGESGGEPRQLESTRAKAKDVQNAVSFLQTLDSIDPEQIGALGVCAGAGNVIFAATADQRVKALATIAAWLQQPTTTPLIYGDENLRQHRIDLAQAAEDKYEKTGEMDYVPAYDPAEGSGAAMFFPIDYYGNPNRGAIPKWKNQFAVVGWTEWLQLNSVEKAANIQVPVQMVHSDGSAFPQNVRQFFDALPGEKDLHWTQGEHTQFYDEEPYVDKAARVVVDHFQRVFRVDNVNI